MYDSAPGILSHGPASVQSEFLVLVTPICKKQDLTEMQSPVGLSMMIAMAGPDAPVNPCIYWVSTYDKKKRKFDLEGAHGPFRCTFTYSFSHFATLIHNDVLKLCFACQGGGPHQIVCIA